MVLQVPNFGAFLFLLLLVQQEEALVKALVIAALVM